MKAISGGVSITPTHRISSTLLAAPLACETDSAISLGPKAVPAASLNKIY